MKQKIENCFVISHLKKAIWNLECANKLRPETVDKELINDLKATLIILKNKAESGDDNA